MSIAPERGSGILPTYTMSTPENKQLGDAGETGVSPLKSPCSDTSDRPIDPEAERKLLLKLDLTLFPVFFVIYMMAFLDRINISNASIQGLTAELHLDEGNRFNIALFVCHLSLSPPLFTRRVRATGHRNDEPAADHLDPRHTIPRISSSRCPPT